MQHVHLAHGLALHEDRVLLVASRYAGYPDGLWNLPGGRQEPSELLQETAAREIFEETSIRARCGDLAYVNESYDRDRHIIAAIFHVDVEGQHVRIPTLGDHVVAAAWVALDRIGGLAMAEIVRRPLLAYLRGDATRYYGAAQADISVDWEPEDR
ncbi:MAG TPA: NUDIX domain-containing protein [Candidatus Dormibacteraeota bacterium]|nr:NUDIX domain-containing protein [Candidatus Dormibacteraeota bacterium]